MYALNDEASSVSHHHDTVLRKYFYDYEEKAMADINIMACAPWP
jgi:hypothetical protein